MSSGREGPAVDCGQELKESVEDSSLVRAWVVFGWGKTTEVAGLLWDTVVAWETRCRQSADGCQPQCEVRGRTCIPD